MFYQYWKKNMLPSDYSKLSNGEKKVLKAFTLKEIELNKNNNQCPLFGGE